MVKRSPRLQRYRERRAERGMAVFLVVLVLTMIGAIGVFSMHSASLVHRAAGFNRQNVQATAMVEFGMRGVATWVGRNKDIMTSSERVPGCADALLAADPEAKCVPIKDTLLTDTFSASAPVTLTDGVFGLLNSPWDATSIRAEVVTELTEVFDGVAIPGSPGRTREMTFTTRSRIYPINTTSTTTCGTGASGTMSQQRARAHVIVQL